MLPYAIMNGDLEARHFSLYRQVCTLINGLPNGLSCHEVCREIIKAAPDLLWYKGKFAGWDHSWLEVVGSRVIIDAYPWASAAPIMVVNETGTPWATLYRGEIVGNSVVGGPTNAERDHCPTKAEDPPRGSGAACPTPAQ